MDYTCTYSSYSLWPTVIFDKNVTEIKVTLMLRTSLESSFYADHNGTILKNVTEIKVTITVYQLMTP